MVWKVGNLANLLKLLLKESEQQIYMRTNHLLGLQVSRRNVHWQKPLPVETWKLLAQWQIADKLHTTVVSADKILIACLSSIVNRFVISDDSFQFAILVLVHAMF